jgi:RHS repeat-associated protein
MKLSQIVFTLIYSTLLIFSSLVSASGIRVATSEADYATGQYRNQSIDLSVKVIGGYIRVSRTFSNKRWSFNRGAEGAVLSYVRQHDAQPTEIEVSGISYRLDPNSIDESASGSDPQAVYFTEREDELGQQESRIEKFDDSYRWSDEAGNWLNYDDDGQLIEGGDRNTVITRTTRDAQNRIFQVLDANNSLIMTYEYLDAMSNKIKSIEDYSGRSVQYHWQDEQLAGITDVNGERWDYAYSSTGDLITLTDPLERKTQIDYVSGIVTRITQPIGAYVEYTYDYDEIRKRYYVREKNSSGTIIEKYYDQSGMLLEQRIDGLLIRKTSENSSGSNKTRLIKAFNGTSVTQTFNQQGKLIKNLNNDGSFETAEYNGPYNKISKHRDVRGKITAFEYDANGNVKRITEAVGTALSRSLEFEYDEFGQRLQINYPADALTLASAFHNTYDAYGNVKTVTDALGNIRTYQYNVLARITQSTDANQQVWKNTFNASGDLLTTEDPLGNTYQASYNAAGERIKVIAPNGRISINQYDAAGRVVGFEVRDSDQAVLTRSLANYNDSGRSITYTDALGYSASKVFNSLGQVESTTNRAGEISSFQYQQGILAATKVLDYGRYFSYDLAGNINQETIKWGGSQDQNSQDQNIQEHNIVRQRTLNASGQATEQLDGNNNKTKNQYDILGRISQVTDAIGGLTSYGYNSRNNLIRFTDAEGRTTRFDYDSLNRKVAEHRSPQEGITHTRRYFYGKNNELLQEISPKGDVILHSYNAVGNKIKTQYFSAVSITAEGLTKNDTGDYDQSELSGITQAQVIEYAYNAMGQLIELKEQEFRQTYQYTLLGQIKQVESYFSAGAASQNQVKTQRYEYNERGEKTAYINPEGIRYEYSYTPNGEIARVNIPQQGNISFSGYRGGKPASILFPGGTRQRLTYDGLNRLLSKELINPADDNQGQGIYSYGKEHNILSISRSFGTINYDYDNLYRLTQANHPLLDNEEYQYDGVYNRIQRTLTPLSESAVTDNWQYNSDNQLVSYSSVNNYYQFTYDANGNTIERNHCSDSASQNCSLRFYTYDARERLVKIEDQIKTAGTLDNKQVIAEYGYNQLGQRIWKKVADKTTYFLFDKTGLVAEYDETFNLAKEYSYTPNATFMTNPLFMRSITRSAETIESDRMDFYFNDHLGASLKLFSQSGMISWSANASAFGEAHINQESVVNNLRFPGQYFDQETGTHYNYYRDYNAELGRYLQSDPIGLGGGVNRYNYVSSNSITKIDPYGLFNILFEAGASGVAGGGLGGSTGLFLTLDSSASTTRGQFDVGVISAGWVGGGFDLSAGPSITFLVGGNENINGNTVTEIVDAFIIDLEFHFNPATNEFVGASIGFDLTPLPGSAVVLQKTVTYSIWEYIDWTLGCRD